MPRKARIDAPGALHHIIARGIERREIFCDDEDRDDFLRRLGEIVSESKTQCYAWALLPNHFHLLLKTGDVPVATVMRRLLSGYVSRFNRRHDRSGHLFQNRYKSILCQENIYLKELVRYIHLNPLRAGVMKTLGELDDYLYCGHGRLMGKFQNDWQETNSVLTLFADRVSTARDRYRTFVEAGAAAGRRPELTGGGLVRSAGGWQAIQEFRNSKIHQKSDERILGDSEFVEGVLARTEEALHRKYALATQGVGIEEVMQGVSELTGVPVEALTGAGKKRETVSARSLLCFWAVTELGMSLTELAGRLGIGVSTVGGAVQRGAHFAERKELKFTAILNVKI
jgi:REP element-mobilizing transposase RayT